MRIRLGTYACILGAVVFAGAVALILGPFLGWGPMFEQGGLADQILFALSETSVWAVLLVIAAFGAGLLFAAWDLVRRRSHVPLLQAIDGRTVMMATGGLLVLWFGLAGLWWNFRGEL